MASVIFMGTPDFAVPTLRALHEHHDVRAVVTQPDRPAGRGAEMRQPPVKQFALEAGLPVIQPEKLRRAEAQAELEALVPVDVFVVAAFGQILPQAVLDMPRHGCINVHASLLPRWRGAAPIHAAIRAGDTETGVTIMVMDAGLDTGPMLSHARIPIDPEETGQSLHDKLAVLGAKLLIDTLPGYLEGAIKPQPQDDSLATYAPQIKKEDGGLDWNQPAVAIERAVRGFTPWPGTYTTWNGKQLKVHTGHAASGSAVPGEVIRVGDSVAVGTGEGLFVLGDVQLQGRNRLDIEAFTNGYLDFVGSRLGE